MQGIWIKDKIRFILYKNEIRYDIHNMKPKLKGNKMKPPSLLHWRFYPLTFYKTKTDQNEWFHKNASDLEVFQQDQGQKNRYYCKVKTRRIRKITTWKKTYTLIWTTCLDKAPRLSIRKVIWILASDTVFVKLNQ